MKYVINNFRGKEEILKIITIGYDVILWKSVLMYAKYFYYRRGRKIFISVNPDI